GEEGKFYVWDKKEIASILGDQTSTDIFCEYYGVTEGGNFDGKNILNVRVPVANLGLRYGKTPDQAAQIIADASAKLFASRERRIRPGRDEKILTSWNGLMISGFTKGFGITGDLKYLQSAKNAVKFVETKISLGDGRLRRTFKDGQSKLNAYLDDYAFYTSGLLDLFAVDSRQEYLDKAIDYSDFMLKHFWDENENNLFFTSDDHEELIVRTKNFYDLAIPSGNSVAASNLFKLYHYTQNSGYLERAVKIMKAGARPAAENPFGFGQMLNAIYLYVKKPVEVILITDDHKSDMVGWLNRQFIPDGINAIVNANELPSLQKYAYFKGRESIGETAFVCRNFSCSLPLKSQKELEKQLMPA
ncbi:MAG TPA: thioredoxin, partial [Nitrososphaera sp.]|nr:thioredoxin [Nitrososphaera sp.]